jgi:hypothetical protein
MLSWTAKSRICKIGLKKYKPDEEIILPSERLGMQKKKLVVAQPSTDRHWRAKLTAERSMECR